jgi:hypothetical protein
MSSVTNVIRRTIKNFRIKRGKENKSVIRQIWENLMLILRLQLEPKEYYLFRLYPKKVNKGHVINYLNSAQFTRDINPVLNPPEWHYILNDKLFSNRYFRNLGIPVAHQYGFYSKDFGFLNSGGKLSSRKDFLNFLMKEKPENIVLKPHNTFGGYGILIYQNIQYSTEILFKSSNGTAIKINDLSDKIDGILNTNKSIRGLILEAVVEQHPVLTGIYPHSVNTLRIITYLTKDDQPKIIGTRIRIGRNDNLVDNISQGGIHAAIDMETGKTTDGLLIISGVESYITNHPDTGVKLNGIEIPYWQRILDLCRKVAKATSYQRFVGWDIAVGKSGPVLIEGNSTGVEVAFDQLNDRWFLTEEFRNDMLEYGIRFPDKLPGISPRKIYQSYKISRRMNKIDY